MEINFRIPSQTEYYHDLPLKLLKCFFAYRFCYHTFLFYLQINNNKSTGYFMLIALMHSVIFEFNVERKKNGKWGTKNEITCIYSTFHVECALRASCIGNESRYHFSWIEDGNADNTIYPTKEGKHIFVYNTELILSAFGWLYKISMSKIYEQFFPIFAQFFVMQGADFYFM